MDNNRFEPGCVSEQAFVNETVAQMHDTKQPIGGEVDIGVVGDPMYAGGDWVKYETEIIMRNSSKVPGSVTIRKQIRIHYFFNHATKQVAQVKLKNSYESGCIGIPTTSPN